jgi:2-oxoglutarate ferredoxin oxidoreductase subunit gamma
MRTEIRISGFGGQGIGLAGHIIGKALSIYGDKEAVMTQTYGPEARGGASSANIVTSDRVIDYPFVLEPDILIALSQEAYTKFRPTAKDSALILIDSGLVKPFDGDEPLTIPATKLAEEMGNRIVTNIVMLGFFTSMTNVIDRKFMEKAIDTTVKARFVELNLKAFETGYVYALEKAA